jgi:hypothetical protein
MVLWRGSPSRELESTAAYRPGLNNGDGWRNPEMFTGWNNPQCPSDLPDIMA